MQVRFRPITTWPGERTPEYSRRGRYVFKAGWQATLNLLERELEQLDAREVAIEVDLREDQIRIDGWPKSGANPQDPGVVVSFDSKYGPLRYATDVFDGYEANVRAIALGLEALRKVDRYGITRRGEQYTGWKALGSGIALGAGNGFASREEAARFLIEHGEWGGTPASVKEILEAEPQIVRAYFREAAKKLHPDVGGDENLFRRLNSARELLGVARA